MNLLLPRKPVTLILLTSIWINASEVFRYFVIVMPAMRKALSVVPNVAPMNWQVFTIWGIWDAVLTIVTVFVTWLCANVFGKTTTTIMIAGTTCWATFFLLFWLALVNMNLSNVSLLWFTLPLSWIEMTIAAWITVKLLKRQDR
jgi:hypothetical protein